MAIYIQIRKKDEDHTGAIYEFGPSELMVGTVFIARDTCEVSLLHIDDLQRSEFYLSRVRRVLQSEIGEFPERTCYKA